MRTIRRSNIPLATPQGILPTESRHGPCTTHMLKLKCCLRSNPTTFFKPANYAGFHAAANK